MERDMSNKYALLIVFFLLILTKGASAETEREVIVNHTQSATWAYYTDDMNLSNVSSNSRWYISPISGTTVRTDAYSLGPITNGVGGWWTVGTGVATFDSSVSNISIAPNLDTDPSDTFLDVGLQQNVTNSIIHSDRQRLQGKTHPIEWYFFQAPNGLWYIVNAPGYGTVPQVLKFAGKNGQYVWPPVDVSGYSYTAIPDLSGNFLAITFSSNGSPSPFLSFPLDCGDVNCTFKYSQRAYTPSSMFSVLDHQMSTVYGTDGTVTAYTGESGVGTPKALGCYPKVGGGSFSVNGLYRGTNDGCLPAQGLNYDGHPGYDYVAVIGTPVKAAASGTVVNIMNKQTGNYGICVPKGIDLSRNGVKHECSDWGFVGIDHGNGYVIQYGHLSRIDVHAGDTVQEGQQIGLSGQTSPPPSVGPHLHFEVLKAKQSAPYGYTVVDPYGWEGTGIDTLEQITGIKNVRLWK